MKINVGLSVINICCYWKDSVDSCIYKWKYCIN